MPHAHYKIMKNFFVGILVFGVLLPPGAASGKEYSIAPIPAWVKRSTADVEITSPKEDIVAGVRFILVEMQTQHLDGLSCRFNRFVIKVEHAAGLDKASNKQIVFDPDREAIILHKLDIRRKGEVIDALPSSSILIAQREEELDDNIMTGEKTMNVTVKDLRVGDILDLSYSLVETKPAFYDLFFDGYYLNSLVPADNYYLRVRVPENSPVQYTLRNIDLKPTIVKLHGFQEFIWQRTNVASVEAEETIPPWYLLYSYVEFSEKASWTELKSWILEKYYNDPVEVSADLQERIEEIKNAFSKPEDRIMAALRFVQDEIAYTAMHLGPGGYHPKPPLVTSRDRFGDCKDKTFLLVTLLRAMQIEAYPVLVNSVIFEHIEDYLPSPGIFDHVIVQIRFNGAFYWVDPTESYSRGDLTHMHQPLYGKVLVLDGAGGLTNAPRSSLMVPDILIEETIDFESQLQSSALLTVKTSLYGENANGIRRDLHAKTRKQLQKEYKDFLEWNYPKLTVIKEMRVEDDQTLNLVVVWEYYRINDIWNHSDYKNYLRIISHNISDYYHDLKGYEEQQPVRVSFPVHVSQITKVLLPRDWKVEKEKVDIRNDVFSFSKNVNYEDRVVTVSFDFMTFKDYVSPDGLDRYRKDMEQMEGESVQWLNLENIRWPLKWHTVHGGLFTLFCGFLVVWGFVALHVHQWIPLRKTEMDAEFIQQYSGVKGFLIVVGVLIVMNIALGIKQSVVNFSWVLSWESWIDHNDPKAVYYRNLNNYFILLVIIRYACFFAFSARQAWTFLFKKYAFIPVTLFYIWSNYTLTGFIVILYAILDENKSSWVRCSLAILLMLVFYVGSTIYMLRSNRVKATFTK